MYKVTAFTILELTIALIISAIVIAAGYYTTLLLAGMFNNKLRKSKIQTEYFLLQKAIAFDLEHCNYAKESQENSDMLLQLQNKIDFINYFFSENFVTRQNQAVVDTFWCGVSNLSTRRVSDSSFLVNYLRIEWDIDGSKSISVFNKRYSSDQLIHYEQTTDVQDE